MLKKKKKIAYFNESEIPILSDGHFFLFSVSLTANKKLDAKVQFPPCSRLT